MRVARSYTDRMSLQVWFTHSTVHSKASETILYCWERKLFCTLEELSPSWRQSQRYVELLQWHWRTWCDSPVSFTAHHNINSIQCTWRKTWCALLWTSKVVCKRLMKTNYWHTHTTIYCMLSICGYYYQGLYSKSSSST